MVRRAGFEPATSRVADDVTAIFTTDRETVGGEPAMLSLPLRATAFRRAGLEPARRRSALPRSNRHLHHRLADARRRTSTIATGTLGNWRYRLSMTSTQVLAFRKHRDPRRNGPREAASTVRDVKGGIRTRFAMERSIRHLHHQRSLSRKTRQTRLKIEKRIPSRRSERRAAIANLRGSLCHRCPACASFPPAGPALRARACLREPRDPGLPFRFCRRNFATALLRKIKYPPELAGSGGSVEADCRFRLGEIAPMSHVRAIDRPQAVRRSDEFFATVLHHTALFRSPNDCRVRGNTPRNSKCQREKRLKMQ